MATDPGELEEIEDDEDVDDEDLDREAGRSHRRHRQHGLSPGVRIVQFLWRLLVRRLRAL